MAPTKDFTSGSSSNPNTPTTSSGSNNPGGRQQTSMSMTPNTVITTPNGQPPHISSTDVPDYLINYNERYKSADPVLFRDDSIDQTIAALISQKKPNALLVGSAGVGKTKLIEDIARRIANNDPSIPAPLQGYTIYEMPVGEFTAGQSLVGAIEERAQELVAFISDPVNKAIVFIDEIHMLMTSQTADKAVQILKAPLARGDFRVIGATTSQEVRFLNDDPALMRRFSLVQVDELTIAQTIEVVKAAMPSLREHYHDEVIVDDAMAEEITKVAQAILPSTYHRPDNALTLLDRAMAQTTMMRSKAIKTIKATASSTMSSGGGFAMPPLSLSSRILENTASRIRSGTAEVPDFDMDRAREAMKTKVLGQDHLVDRTLDLIRRRKLALFPSNRPLSLMFAGPSGVGKTSLANIIANEITNQDALILNMGEYNNRISTTKILGSPDGYAGSDSKRELPFDPLMSNPHRVILLDEAEKADRTIMELFLSVLDSGTLTNARGMTYDFSNAIIIFTTNAGREILDRDALGFGSTAQTNENLSNETLTKALKDSFAPELLGRMSDMFAFNTLSKDVYKDICVSIYEQERTRILDERPNVKLPATLDDDQIEDLLKTQVPKLGARPARRAVTRLIEDIAII